MVILLLNYFLQMNKIDNYVYALEKHNISSTSMGIYRFVGAIPTQEYGWKLHVSLIECAGVLLLSKSLKSISFKIAHILILH